jgi:hypothetical protein
VAEEKESEKKRGPKGGVKHTPGRGHQAKSGPGKKKKYRKNAAKKRREKEEAARKIWQAWDELSDEQKKLLGPKGAPKVPRPKNED